MCGRSSIREARARPHGVIVRRMDLGRFTQVPKCEGHGATQADTALLCGDTAELAKRFFLRYSRYSAMPVTSTMPR